MRISEMVGGSGNIDDRNPYFDFPADVVADWIYRLDITGTTRDKYLKVFRQFCAYVRMVGLDPDKMETRDIIEFKDYLVNDRHLAASTVSLYLSVIRSFYRFAGEQGLADIADNVKGASISREYKKDILSVEDVAKLVSSFSLDSERSYRDRAIVSLMLHTGIRAVECSRLTIGDLSESDGRHLLRVEGKGYIGSETLVVLSPTCYGHLVAYLGIRGDRDPSHPLFISTSSYNRGKAISSQSVSKSVKAALRRAGYDSSRLTTHSLRHTAATLALAGGASVEEVQGMMRHADLGTTMLYTHLADRLERPAEDAAASLIDAAIGQQQDVVGR